MSNDTVVFEYQRYFSGEEISMLEAAEYAINADFNQAGECLIRAGQRLIAVKESLKGKDEGFMAWCDTRLPIGYRRAYEYMQVAREFGNMNPDSFFSKKGPGHQALAKLSAIKDEEVKALVYEKTKERIESGEKVTRVEFLETAKALEQAKQAAEGKVLDLQAALDGYIAERQAADEEARIAKEEAKAARAARDKVIHELMDKEAERRKLEARIKGHQQAMADAEAVYREQLEEMRARIVAEERARPRTDAELAEQQKKLQALREEETRLAQGLARQRLEHEHAKEALRDTRVAVQLRDAVLSDFSKAAQQFRQTCLLLGGAADALRQIPMTEELYAQVEMVRKLSLEVADNLKDALSV